VRLLSEADVARLVDGPALIAASAEAYRAIADGSAKTPLRTEFLRPEVGGVVFVMPSLIGERLFGLKVIANRADGAGGLATTALVLLMDAQSLEVLGLVAADLLTDYRTAAGLAAAVDALAPPRIETHALYGAGKLAGPSALLIQEVRPASTLLLVGRSRDRVERLAAELCADPRMAGVAVRTDVGADDAAAAADLVTCVTTATQPVFDGRHLRDGTHVTVGGAFHRGAREVDDAVARRARVFTDSMVACLERAGDLVQPLESGVMRRDQVEADIGAVLGGSYPFVRRAGDVTLFKSLGTAAQDLVTAEHLLAAARLQDLGVTFDPTGDRTALA
jgi:ornithine cyclodeaminase/alanine dehydrogenase-like protein (mu-crystallin family)